MNRIQADIIIIGAGLTGLTLAHFLKEQDLKVAIVEARDCIGGRIRTINKENNPPLEMGATWLSDQHMLLRQLLQDLDIEIFMQELGATAIYEPFSTAPAQLVKLPPSDSPSYRIKGGTDVLIRTLANQLNENQIFLNSPIAAISIIDNKIVAANSTKTYEGSIIISTLPPLLLANTITCNPSLPDEVTSLAQQTHTWMGDSIKVALSFKNKFWNAEQLSGTIFSNVGPISEMYDHSNIEDSMYALKGFFNGAYHHVSKAERLKLVLTQLEKYYGSIVRDYLTYEELVWKNEQYTATKSSQNILPHQNNGIPQYQRPYLDGRFYIAGTETSPINSGYMEGAIRSATFIYEQIQQSNLV